MRVPSEILRSEMRDSSALLLELETSPERLTMSKVENTVSMGSWVTRSKKA